MCGNFCSLFLKDGLLGVAYAILHSKSVFDSLCPKVVFRWPHSFVRIEMLISVKAQIGDRSVRSSQPQINASLRNSEPCSRRMVMGKAGEGHPEIRSFSLALRLVRLRS